MGDSQARQTPLVGTVRKLSLIRVTLTAALVVVTTFGTTALRGQAAATGANLSGPDTPETDVKSDKHLLGDWHGERDRLAERGASFDLLYVSDSLANVRSAQPRRFTSFTRVRGTVDLDMGKLVNYTGVTIHLSGVWQSGANLGKYLGTIVEPSALTTTNAFRLDSWWVEKSLHMGRIAIRAGQFAGLDSYGSQYLGSSFLSQAMGYAFTTLPNTYATFQPFATSAAEVRVAELKHAYIKSMVLAGDRLPTEHNLTGFVPQFRGAPVSISEIGWTPGIQASELKSSSTVDTRKGYSGVYKFGAAFNPGKFQTIASNQTISGNYTIYGTASQALYRLPGRPGSGPDLTAGITFSPADRNKDTRLITVGVRYDDLLPLKQHNTFAVALVHSSISRYVTQGNSLTSNGAENLVEFDGTIALTPAIIFQPVAERILNVGGSTKADTILGFRSKVVF